MDDIEQEQLARIKWLIARLRERYSQLRHHTPFGESEPSGVSTFFNGLFVVDRCIQAGDPQLDMYLRILITTSWLSVESHCHNDFASDDEKIRSMALWRRSFFDALEAKSGLECICEAMDAANAEVVKCWIAGMMDIDYF